ncbi:MAG: DUF2793 domain-containing protein [Pseudomonadota bacterium]
MSETYHLSLPLVAAAQAQKHVTVNEALARLDTLAQLRVVSAVVTDPPADPVDGQSYIVPDTATGEWSGRGPEIAVFANGAWAFISPKAGWCAWNEATGSALRFDGIIWAPEGSSAGSDAATVNTVVEVEHTLGTGASSTVVGAIPANTVVLGVTGRVTSALGGTATSWRLGVSGSDDRYGSGLGTGTNSYALGLTGQPLAYYTDTDLVLTADGGAFAGGIVRLAVHCFTLQPPAAV